MTRHKRSRPRLGKFLTQSPRSPDTDPQNSAPDGERPAPPVRKRSPQAEARRVAIPFAVVITAFLACCMLTGLLTDKSKAPSRDSTFELVLSIIAYIGFLAAIVWGVWCAFRGKGRAWRESRARSEAARGRLAGRSARHRAGGRDTLSPADPALSRYRHMKWYHGGPLGEDR